jgi:hypothetical protein
LCGMLFTLVVWVFGVLSFILAILFYGFFLWHYIPNRDGGLAGYCRRKVDKRLAQIVSVKVNKAIEEEERRRHQLDKKGLKKGEKPPIVGRQATLPTLFDPKNDDQLPQMPILDRNDTTQSLPLYSSRPETPSGEPTLPAFELNNLNRRPVPSRNATNSSATSYASNAPLMANAAETGRTSPVPSLPLLDTNGYPDFPPPKPITPNSTRSQWSDEPNQGPPRLGSAIGDRGYTASPVSYTNGRSNTPGGMSNTASADTFGRPMPRQMNEMRSNTPMGPAPSMGRRTPFDPNTGRSSPATYRNDRNSPAPSSNSGYAAYNPGIRNPSVPPQQMNGPPGPQQRSPTDQGYFNHPQRPGTAQSQRSMGPNTNRLASPAPYRNGGPSPGYAPMGPDNAGYRNY